MEPKGVFNPNVLTFEDGVKRVQKACDTVNFKVGDKPITSKDALAEKIRELLQITNIPGGFKKWQIPFIMDRSQLYISCGFPDTIVPEHSHDEGNGIRFIINGSIIYNGQELTAGDWLFVPKGAKYSITVGKHGVTMCCCYQCCC